jgi:hypothetical protein
MNTVVTTLAKVNFFHKMLQNTPQQVLKLFATGTLCFMIQEDYIRYSDHDRTHLIIPEGKQYSKVYKEAGRTMKPYSTPVQ